VEIAKLTMEASPERVRGAMEQLKKAKLVMVQIFNSIYKQSLHCQ
jgi:hypothetical protein